MSSSAYLRLVSTGAYLPKQRVSNDELKEKYQLDTSHEWIVARSGICFRHFADKEETTAHMAAASARVALADAGWCGEDLDLVICATCTPDRSLPSTALEVHRELGCVDSCPAFDVGAACSGFIYALSVADSMMRGQDSIERVLVIGAERMSKIIDWSDRSSAVLFGDGAASVLFERSSKPGHHLTRLFAAGRFSDLLNTDVDSDKLFMQGRAVFRHAVSMMEGLVDVLLNEAGFVRDDIDCLVPHQANSRIIQTLADKLQLSNDQVMMNIDELGNTSAASIPIALDSGLRSGKIKPDQLILLEAFGAGFVWGGSLLHC